MNNWVSLREVGTGLWQWEVRCVDSGQLLCNGTACGLILAAIAAKDWIERK